MSSSMSGFTGLQGPSGAQSSGNRIPKGYSSGQLQNFSPEQMELFKSLFSQVGPNSFLSKIAGGDQAGFEEMEAPAMRQFQGLLGENASRFSGLGMGSRHGSGFQNSTNQITSDFAQDLQSKRQGMQMNAIKELMGLSGDLLNQKPFENFLTKNKKDPSFLESILGSLFGGLGNIGGQAGGMSLIKMLFGG